MGMPEIEDALVTIVGNMSGISECYDGMPESLPVNEAPIAWIELVYLGAERQSGGARSQAAIEKHYKATVYFLLGEENMIEADAREAAKVWPAEMETAIADETLGGVCWDCQIAPSQSGNNLDKYEDIEGVYPLSWIVLDITDY